MTASVILDATCLPLKPGTATRVLEMLDDPDTSAADIGAVVKVEPVITARVLGLANSPVFHRGRDIAEIRHAVVVGQSAVRGIALGVAMDSLFEDDSSLDPAHWTHALKVAAAAVATSRQVGADAGEAFTAGLMHDIGEIAMASHSPEAWLRISEETELSSSARLALEVELFGIDHAHLGGAMLAEFGLPSRSGHAVAGHHRPMAEADEPLAICVTIAAAIGELPDSDDIEACAAALLQSIPDLGMDAEALLVEAELQGTGLLDPFS